MTRLIRYLLPWLRRRPHPASAMWEPWRCQFGMAVLWAEVASTEWPRVRAEGQR